MQQQKQQQQQQEQQWSAFLFSSSAFLFPPHVWLSPFLAAFCFQTLPTLYAAGCLPVAPWQHHLAASCLDVAIQELSRQMDTLNSSIAALLPCWFAQPVTFFV